MYSRWDAATLQRQIMRSFVTSQSTVFQSAGFSYKCFYFLIIACKWFEALPTCTVYFVCMGSYFKMVYAVSQAIVLLSKYVIQPAAAAETPDSLVAHIPPCFFAPFLHCNLQQTCLLWTCTRDSAPLLLHYGRAAPEKKNNFDWQSSSASKQQSTMKVDNIFSTTASRQARGDEKPTSPVKS